MALDFLAGVRVLDLSQYIPGPFATLMLADMGAEVVKVEPPAGDPMRGFGPRDADGLSPFYKVLNRNKTVVRLDLKIDDGKAAFAELAAAADVLLESFRPGTLDRLGFGCERLRQLSPGLVHCALSGFGQAGPYAMRAGHDLTYVALTGGLAVSGTRHRPVMTFPPLADHAGAMQATTAILGALVRRGRSGQGAFLDVSLFESALSWQYMALLAARRPGRPPGREEEMINGGAAYYRIYRTADSRFAALAPIEEKFWRAFCEAVGRPDLIPRQDEPLPQEALIAELDALFAGRPLADWQALLEPADCCFEAVLAPSDVPSHPQVAARGMVAAGGDVPLEVLSPIFADDRRPQPRRPFSEEPVAAVVERWRRRAD